MNYRLFLTLLRSRGESGSSGKHIEELFGLFEICRVKTFSEPTVNILKYLPGFFFFPLFLP